MQVVLARFERAWDFLPATAAIPSNWLKLGDVGELLAHGDLPQEIERRIALA